MFFSQESKRLVSHRSPLVSLPLIISLPYIIYKIPYCHARFRPSTSKGILHTVPLNLQLPDIVVNFITTVSV